MATRYENLKSIKDEQFRRLTGVKRHTFNRILEILQEAFQRKMAIANKGRNLASFVLGQVATRVPGHNVLRFVSEFIVGHLAL